jgi:peptidoglycan/LPS O-acetylase OafA/YrhL
MAERPRSEPKFEFIDAARGIAILLVLVCHTAVSQQPWPIRRFTELGWHGVQLFFVVSSMTLALSWQYRRDGEVYPFLNFLVRRVFRIWPMYCLAYLAYLVIWPPTMPLSIARVLAALTFMSGWSPGPLPVTETWGGVPGGWSVEDEFDFYLLFPLLIWIAATPLRAILLVVVSLVVAGACNSFSYGHYVATYGNSVTDQWMYYSFPNQLPVFALGFVAYHAFIRLQPGGAWDFLRARLLPLCPLLIIIAMAMFLSLGLTRVPRASTLWPPILPVHILAGIAFVLGVVAIGLRPYRAIVSWPMVWLGKVSFSVYLVHFAVDDASRRLIPGFFGPSVEGWIAIAASIALLLATLSVSFAVSLVTYHLVEQPMIARGRLVCKWLNRVIAPRPAAQTGTGLR